jgi:LPXTG-motif cell wall-anchored protein
VKIRSIAALTVLTLLLTMAIAGPAFAEDVSEVDFDFVPASLTVSAGATVTWTNNGASPHTSTSDSGAWDSGTMDPGDTFSHTFSSAGTFPYHCDFHEAQGMVGTITVEAQGGTTTAPGGGTTLPATGSDSSTGMFLWLGLLFLLSGGFALYLLRRRRA